MKFRTGHRRPRGRPHLLWSWLGLLLLAAPAALARINVVTLPGRDSVQLTIYNSADLTLVKETRVLTFRTGLNWRCSHSAASRRNAPAFSRA